MKKSILITGAAGFIGSHLVDALLQKGHTVIGLDNLCTGRVENLDNARKSGRFSLYEEDISDFESIKKYFHGIDWVFHLAALADIVPSIQHPMEYHQSNVNGTLSVLEAARLAGVERFLYAASSSCYGIPENYPTSENTTLSPMYPYALTKLIGEQMVLHWHQIYQLPATSLRLFNVYGPRARTSGTYGAVFGTFLAQKLAGKPFTVVGDGSQTRDFTYVTDVAQAFIAAASSDSAGEIFNVGSGATYSINQLVDLLGGDVTYIPKRPGEPDCTFADTTKILSKLAWEPCVEFERGVRCMLESIDDWREAPVWEPSSIAEATKEWFAHLSDSSNIDRALVP